MIFRKQLEDDDCFRTALGCLLNLEPQDVPHFVRNDGGMAGHWTEEGRNHVRDWLKEHSVEMLESGFYLGEGTLDMLMNNITYLHGRDIIYLLTGANAKGLPHVVICRGDKLLWDPSPIHSELPGPLNGTYWVAFFSSSFFRYNGEMP
jgi:hypothetical protein